MNEKQFMLDRNLITVEVNYQFIKSQIILQYYYYFRILVARHKTPHKSLTLTVSDNTSIYGHPVLIFITFKMSLS